MMRICWFSVSDQLGGSEMALITMLDGLRVARPGWTHQVVLPGNGPLKQRAESAGASCTVVPMPPALSRIGESATVRDRWRPGAALALGLRLGATAVAVRAYEKALAQAIAPFQPDLIHTNGLKAHVLGARIGLPHPRLVWHLHEYVSQRRFTRWLMRRYVRRCAAMIANSASVAADVASIFDQPPPVRVVRNAVDLRVFRPDGPGLDLDALSGLPPAPADVVRVGLVATFARWKGQQVFLDALQRIPASRPVRGYIVGGPLYDTPGSQYSRRELEAMIDARNLRCRVGLTGFVDSAAAMRTLDVVVHASIEREPFGLVIAEGMACGRAVITTGHGGAAELIEAERDALVAPPADSRALATAIERVAADPELREALGIRARTAALARFAPDRMAAELAQVFETAGGRRPLAQSA
jgi:glycosyltransferase involved in cell wall biosynthesis